MSLFFRLRWHRFTFAKCDKQFSPNTHHHHHHHLRQASIYLCEGLFVRAVLPRPAMHMEWKMEYNLSFVMATQHSRSQLNSLIQSVAKELFWALITVSRQHSDGEREWVKQIEYKRKIRSARWRPQHVSIQFDVNENTMWLEMWCRNQITKFSFNQIYSGIRLWASVSIRLNSSMNIGSDGVEAIGCVCLHLVYTDGGFGNSRELRNDLNEIHNERRHKAWIRMGLVVR